MTRFGKHLERSGRDLVEEAVAEALRDAGVEAHDVQAAFVGNAAAGLMSGQESVRGQVVLRRTGLMGVPMVNVENACASSSTALHLAWQAVATGIYDRVVVVGYEKLCQPDKARSFRAINASMDLTELAEVFGDDAGQEHSVFMDLYGFASNGQGRDLFDAETLALVSVKNHHHGTLNPRSRYREDVTVEQVLGARRVVGPLTVLMCSSLSDGAACLVLGASEQRRGKDRGVRIAASVLASGRGDDLTRTGAVRQAAREAFTTAAVGPEDLDVAEVHDATAVAELLAYETLGFGGRGEAARLVRDRETWLGGRLPVNPSGGLISRGHPIGATGAAQVVELAWQLQGRCGGRQVPDAKLALAHNVGGWIGSDVAACCVHVLQT